MNTPDTSHVRQALVEARAAIDGLLTDESTLQSIAVAAAIMSQILQAGGRILTCGNGGSLCDAMHLAEELTGRFRLDRPALPAMAISDPAHLSCVANDFGYEQVFARYVRAHARNGDCLVAISTSGSSPNVLAAAAAAREVGCQVVGLTGQADSKLRALSDVCVSTPAGHWSDRVQELHIKVIHIWVESIERVLFPQLGSPAAV